MAEETLKYNIEINQEDLASQLEQVRNQIDLTLGSTAFAQDAAPSASSLVNIPEGGIFAAPDVSGQGVMENVMASLDQASQYTQLGFTKFQEDARRIGLLADSNIPSFNANVPIYDQGPGGYFNSAVGALAPELAGFDYDRSGMTRTEYRARAFQKIGNALDPTQNEWLFTGLGAAGGLAVGGFGGAIAGVGIGGGLDLANQILGAKVRERESLEEGFKQIALQNFGPIHSRDAERMAETLQDKAYSFEGRSLGYDIDTMQENLLGFANSGGFKNVTTADEMEDVMEGVIENARQFANNFKMKQQEAVQVMAQLSQNMIVDPSEMGDFSARMEAFSSFTGMNPVDALGYGMQGVQMTRGMGFEAETSFNMAMEARLQAERLRRADPTTRQLINDLGGADNFALSQIENSVRYMSSGAGLLSSAAFLQGGAEGMGSTQDVLSQAGNFISSDPLNMFRLTARQPEVMTQLGLGGMQALQFNNIFNQVEAMGWLENGQIDEDAMIGIMTASGEMSAQQARANLATIRDLRRQDPVQKVYDDFIIESQSWAQEQNTGVVGEMRGYWGEKVANPFWRLVEPVGEGMGWLGNWTMERLEDAYDNMNDNVRIRPQDFSEGELMLVEGTANEDILSSYENYKKAQVRRPEARTEEEFREIFTERGNMGEMALSNMTNPNLPAAKRGFTSDRVNEMTRGLTEDETNNFYWDYIATGDYTPSDFELFEAASEFDDPFSLTKTQESDLTNLMAPEDIRDMDTEAYMADMSERYAQQQGLDSADDLSTEQRRAVTSHIVNAKGGERYFGDREREIARKLTYSDRVMTYEESAIDIEEQEALAANLREEAKDKLFWESNKYKFDSDDMIEAVSRYRQGGEDASYSNIAADYDFINRERLEEADALIGEDIVKMNFASAAAKETEMKKDANNLAAQFGDASEKTRRLAGSFLTRMRRSSIDGGDDSIYSQMASDFKGLEDEELSAAEQEKAIQDIYTSNIDRVTKSGSIEEIEKLNQDELGFASRNNEALKTAVLTRMAGMFDEEGRVRVLKESPSLFD